MPFGNDDKQTAKAIEIAFQDQSGFGEPCWKMVVDAFLDAISVEIKDTDILESVKAAVTSVLVVDQVLLHAQELFDLPANARPTTTQSIAAKYYMMLRAIRLVPNAVLASMCIPQVSATTTQNVQDIDVAIADLLGVLSCTCDAEAFRSTPMTASQHFEYNLGTFAWLREQYPRFNEVDLLKVSEMARVRFFST